jgi:hypothetical protein
LNARNNLYNQSYYSSMSTVRHPVFQSARTSRPTLL